MAIKAPALRATRKKTSRDRAITRVVANVHRGARPRANPANILGDAPSITAVLRAAHDRVQLQGRASLMDDLEALLELARAYTFSFERVGNKISDTPRAYVVASLYAMWLALGLWGAVNSEAFASGEDEWAFAQWLAGKLLADWRDEQEPLNRFGLLPITNLRSWNLTIKNLEAAKDEWRQLANDRGGATSVMGAIRGPYTEFSGDHAVGNLRSIVEMLDPQARRRLDSRVHEYLTILQEGEAYDSRKDMADDRLIEEYLRSHTHDNA